MSTNDAAVAAATAEADYGDHEDIDVPAVEEENFDFEVTDMDVPKKIRMKSSLTAEECPASPGSPTAKGSLNQQRFRKKSVNLNQNEPDMAALEKLQELFVQHASDGLIAEEQLMEMLAALYKPSESENNFLLMWFDFTGDNLVSFDEYTVVLAAVLKDAGLTAADGLDKARESLMANVERVMLELAEGGADVQGTRSRHGAVGSYLGEREYGPEVIEQAKGELEGLELRPRFEEADLDKDGSLSSTELADMIQVSYKPSNKRVKKLMRYFDLKSGKVNKEDFLGGMFNLCEGFQGFRAA